MFHRFLVLLWFFWGFVSALPTSNTIQPSSAASPTAAVTFVMPGTTLQVLPVGLVVYGGITAIAVMAVLIVTLERVRYRKAFRRQRMAESSWIAYGGPGMINVNRK